MKTNRKKRRMKLTVDILKAEAKIFAEAESKHFEKSLYGITDGKAVGTYLEHKFQEHLEKKYIYGKGSSALGMDFPQLNVDMKTTSIKQPQSSCPYKSAKQKIYGLGYSLLVFAYKKTDYKKNHSAILEIEHVIFVEKDQTGDYQTTTGIQKIIDNNGNSDDIIAFMTERNLPIEEIQDTKTRR